MGSLVDDRAGVQTAQHEIRGMPDAQMSYVDNCRFLSLFVHTSFTLPRVTFKGKVYNHITVPLQQASTSIAASSDINIIRV